MGRKVRADGVGRRKDAEFANVGAGAEDTRRAGEDDGVDVGLGKEIVETFVQALDQSIGKDVEG